jgi:hypothetical protein
LSFFFKPPKGNLGPDDYDHDRVSESTDRKRKKYNCIALAAGDDQIFWWPLNRWGFYWPPQLPKEPIGQETIQNFIRCFELLGYKPCENPQLERGIEKVAIFVGGNGSPTHAARQLESGRWASKCGDYEDIEHYTLV